MGRLQLGDDCRLAFGTDARHRRVIGTRPTIGICQYDLRRFTVEELVDIGGEHTTMPGPDPIYADALLRIARSIRPPGLRLTGDIDSSNIDVVLDSLALAAAEGGDLHLDLSGLQFCDVGGIRAIVTTAQGMEPGRRVVIHGLAPHLRQVMRVVGWDEVPNLLVEAEATP